jgi:hypothetical protein
VSRRLYRLVLAVSFLAVPVVAQEGAQQSAGARVPFGVGELLEYDISYGKIHVGNGNMEVLPFDTVRGRQTWHTIFRLRGGIPFYRVNDRYEDWMDTQTLATLRSHQDIDEGPYEPKRRFEMFPELRQYTENGGAPRPSVEHPLDEGSFLYFLRTVPLRVGMDTSFNDYFRADRNPVRFRVLRRDTIEVGAGRFAAIVVQPIFESKLFQEGGHAEVWLSDDQNHIMLQMKSKVRFGSLSLFLKSYRLAPTATAPLNRLDKR